MNNSVSLKRQSIFAIAVLLATNVFATTHNIMVWSGYYKFLNGATGGEINFSPLTIQLGDTIQFLPVDPPAMMHTITSTSIPNGATAFNQMWQLPADTFFQYIPSVPGVYNFECTPHVSFGMIGSFTVVQGVGITDYTNSDVFFVFPNPSAELINITSEEYLINKPFELYNKNGQIVLSGKLNGVTTQLNISELTPGIYLLVVDNSKRQRIIKIKE
jgi:plastocyanin